MGDVDPPLSDVVVVTMRGRAKPQNATYHLLNVLSELTGVSLVTVSLSDRSNIQEEYDVTEISEGSKGNTFVSTALLFVWNQLLICQTIRERNARVVYFFGGTAYILPILFARLLRKSVVVQPRGDVPLTLQLEWEGQYPAVVARWLANFIRTLEFISLVLATRIVTYTESMAAELGLARFEHKLYPHGTRYIATDEFEPRVPYTERDRRAGMVGRLDVEKGIEELTEAVSRLSEDTKFVFVGDGAKRDWVRERLAGAIESGRVTLPGRVNHADVPDYLSDLKLLVLASEPTEGLPTVVQEAFACGTPVYATPVSAIPDVVREGETGFLMEERSPERIAADIERILDRDDLPEISQNCREFAVEHYSFDASVERFRTLLSGL